MSRSTLLSLTAETQAGPSKETSQMQKEGVHRVPGQLCDSALLPWAMGALEAPDQEKHECSKGIPACATSEGLEAHVGFQTC